MPIDGGDHGRVQGPPSDLPDDNELGRREADAVERGAELPDISRAERRDDYGRNKRFKDAIHEIVVWAIRVIGLALILAVLIWFWHMLAPQCGRWLEKDEVEQLQSLLFSGALSALVTTYIQKRL